MNLGQRAKSSARPTDERAGAERVATREAMTRDDAQDS
jgi:hypothetical protein